MAWRSLILKPDSLARPDIYLFIDLGDAVNIGVLVVKRDQYTF
jgi:hypothetical protein